MTDVTCWSSWSLESGYLFILNVLRHAEYRRPLGTGIPDPPYDMRYVNATHNSITIQWTAGFDGGSPQWFQVRYSETGQEGQKYEDVMPPNSAVYTIKGACRRLNKETFFFVG